MRGIKFRVWDNQVNSFMTESDVRKDSIMGLEFETEGIFFNDNNQKEIRYSFEQYTGLKDKNGKEIYEGDILEFSSSQGKLILEVCFNCGAFSIKATDEILYEYWYPEGYLEVIGNIHENKELL